MKQNFTFFSIILFFMFSLSAYSQDVGLESNKKNNDRIGFQLDVALRLLSPEIAQMDKEVGGEDLLNNTILSGDIKYKFELINFGTDTVTQDSIAYGYISMDYEGNPLDTILAYYEMSDSLYPGTSMIIEPGSMNIEGGAVYGIGGWSYKPNGEQDEYPMNDSTGGNFYVYSPGQVVEKFEQTDFPPYGWQSDGAWSTELPFFIVKEKSKYFEENVAAAIQNSDDPLANLITPKVTVDENHSSLLFDLAGILNGFMPPPKSSGNSFLLIKYTQDLSSGWNILVTYDMAEEGDNIQFKMVDLSSLTGGDYYFSFSTYSTFSGLNPLNGTGVAIDNVVMPVRANATSNDLAAVEADYFHEFIKTGEDAIFVTSNILNNGTDKQTNVSLNYKIDGEIIGSSVIDSIDPNESIMDTVEYNVIQDAGLHNVEVVLPDDDDNSNNTNSFSTVFYDSTMLTYGFESGFPQYWSPEMTPEAQWNIVPDGMYSYEGNYMAICGSGLFKENKNEKAGPFEDVKLYTDKYYVSDNDKFYFTARKLYFLEPQSEEESTLELFYATSKEGPWNKIGETIELTNEWVLHDIDVSTLPEDDYYFAFSASSDYYDAAMDMSGIVLLDFVHTPMKSRPEVSIIEPPDGSANVSETAYVAAIFNTALDSLDFSGLKIENSSGESVAGVYGEIGIPYKDRPIFGGEALQLYHDDFERGETYTATIPANSVTRASGTMGNEEIQWSFTTTLPKPEPVLLYPDTMAEGIPLDAGLYVKFDQEVTRAGGSVDLVSAKTGPLGVYTTNIDPDLQTLVITHENYQYDDTITVTLNYDVVRNADNVPNTDTSWTFYTMTADQPIADSLAPVNNAYTVALDANVEIHFSVPVSENDLTGISIEGENAGSVTGVSATLGNDSVVTISHDAFTENDEVYTVTIPEGAVSSILGGVNNKEIKWTFTTIMTAPDTVKFYPENGATGVRLSYNPLRVEFNQVIDDSQVNLDTVFTIMDENQEEVDFNYAQTEPGGGKSIMIELYPNSFDNNETYTVSMMANAVHNRDSLFNEAFSWQFTTIMSAPIAETYVPAFGSTDVSLDTDISVTFDQDLVVNGLEGVTIKSEKKGYVPGVTATLNTDGRTVDISHDGLFTENNDTYTVKIPYNSLINADDIPNNEVTYNFSTIATYDITFEINDGSDPMEGVSVTLGNENKTTDVEGEAVFADIIDGTQYNYSIEKSGYNSITGYVVVDDHKTLNYTMQTVTGIEDVLKNKVQIYPNPANNIVHINWNSRFRDVKVTMMDITGKTLMTKILHNNENTIDLSGYEEGIYLISIEKDGNKFTSRLIIQ